MKQLTKQSAAALQLCLVSSLLCGAAYGAASENSVRVKKHDVPKTIATVATAHFNSTNWTPIILADINKDGKVDSVIGGSPDWCGATGLCTHIAVVSGAAGYKVFDLDAIYEVRFTRKTGRLTVDTNGLACNLPGSSKCSYEVAWNGTTLTRVPPEAENHKTQNAKMTSPPVHGAVDEIHVPDVNPKNPENLDEWEKRQYAWKSKVREMKEYAQRQRERGIAKARTDRKKFSLVTSTDRMTNQRITFARAVDENSAGNVKGTITTDLQCINGLLEAQFTLERLGGRFQRSNEDPTKIPIRLRVNGRVLDRTIDATNTWDVSKDYAKVLIAPVLKSELPIISEYVYLKSRRFVEKSHRPTSDFWGCPDNHIMNDTLGCQNIATLNGISDVIFDLAVEVPTDVGAHYIEINPYQVPISNFLSSCKVNQRVLTDLKNTEDERLRKVFTPPPITTPPVSCEMTRTGFPTQANVYLSRRGGVDALVEFETNDAGTVISVKNIRDSVDAKVNEIVEEYVRNGLRCTGKKVGTQPVRVTYRN